MEGSASFEINLHSRDVGILYSIQSFFGVGTVATRSDRPLSVYRVTQVKDLLAVIIPHFLNYPLLTAKFSDFYLWTEVVKKMDSKEHLNLSGFLTILPYYASINGFLLRLPLVFQTLHLSHDQPKFYLLLSILIGFLF